VPDNDLSTGAAETAFAHITVIAVRAALDAENSEVTFTIHVNCHRARRAFPASRRIGKLQKQVVLSKPTADPDVRDSSFEESATGSIPETTPSSMSDVLLLMMLIEFALNPKAVRWLTDVLLAH